MSDKTFLEETAAQAAPIDQIPLERPKTLSFRNTFTALRSRNYRLWFWGQMISLLGTWMQSTAQGFLVFQLTQSPVYLGYVGFAYGIPTWIFMLYGGVIADRVQRRNVLVITQSTMMFFAVVLAVLTFTNVVLPWHIIVLAFCLGIANAFDAPSRQAFVNELVPRDDLTNAIALNATMFNTATAIGPAVAGITYALFGPAWCFTINAVSFIGVLTALMMMKIKNKKNKFHPERSTFSDLKEGIRYAAHHKIIRTLILLVGIISLFGISFGVLIPAWAVNILHGDATTNGLLQSFRGIGALTSALLIASLGRFKFKGKLLTLGSFVFPAFLFIFSFMTWLPLSLLFLLAVGFSQILVNNLANALVQTLVHDDLRGRVMGVYTFVFFGLMPLGSLLMGSLAEYFSEPGAVIIGSIVTFAAAVIIYFSVPKLRTQ
ncbi:MAG: MFS transporter [Ignavibacteria bacterium]|jgi:MFS family permease